jgi:thiamine biosynthesis lipoprotein
MNHPTFRHEAMATYFEVIIAGHEREFARQASAAAFREVDRLENTLSRFIESSDISRANRLARGESIPIDDDTLECLLIAADVSIVTRRAFDPSYASIRPAELPPDIPPFTLDPDAHLLTSQAERLHLDLGAVGKGYALDRMAEMLREWQIAAACLNAGGSSVLALDEPAGGAWEAGLGEEHGYRRIALRQASLSASGTAVKGSHLIDPRTGKPALRTTRVWALAPNAAQADALSTAFFVMTEAEIAALCAEHPSIGAGISGADQELIVHGALRAALGA